MIEIDIENGAIGITTIQNLTSSYIYPLLINSDDRTILKEIKLAKNDVLFLKTLKSIDIDKLFDIIRNSFDESESINNIEKTLKLDRKTAQRIIRLKIHMTAGFNWDLKIDRLNKYITFLESLQSHPK